MRFSPAYGLSDMSSSNEQGRGERTPEVSFMRTTMKSVIKALSGMTQASRPASQNGSTAGERTNAETRPYFAEDVLRDDAVIEESTTGLQEILLSSGVGNVETPLSKDLVGEGTSPLREIRFMYGGGVDTFSSMEGRLPEVRSFSAGFAPPNPELRSVPARRSLSGVFGASEIRLKADGYDPSWNRETLRSSPAGQGRPFDPPYPSSPQTPGGDARVGARAGNSRLGPGFIGGGLLDCPVGLFRLSYFFNGPVCEFACGYEGLGATYEG
jgi:hypothetical protein